MISRKLLLSVMTVTIFPAWVMPTWIFWWATWMPPWEDTRRWMGAVALGRGAGPARRTPCRRCRWPGGMGQGRVRHSTPSWVRMCISCPSRRELLPADPPVPRRRDRPVHLDRIRPADRLHCGGGVTGECWRVSEGLQVRRRPQGQPILHGLWRGPEFRRRGGHVQRLVRPVMVVFLPPSVHRGLRGLDRGERPREVEQFRLQGLGRVGRAARCQLGWSFSARPPSEPD